MEQSAHLWYNLLHIETESEHLCLGIEWATWHVYFV